MVQPYEEYSCPICFELLYRPSQPRVCRHTFCNTCLQSHFAYFLLRQKRSAAEPWLNNLQRDAPCCPLCNLVIPGSIRNAITIDKNLQIHLSVMYPEQVRQRETEMLSAAKLGRLLLFFKNMKSKVSLRL